MSEPKTREELEQTIWFKSGAEAKRNKKKLVDVVQCLRFGCWQYDAVVAGYDSAPSKQKVHNAQGNPPASTNIDKETKHDD